MVSGRDKTPAPPVTGLDLTPHIAPSISGHFYLSAGGLLDLQIVFLKAVGPSYQDLLQHLITEVFIIFSVLSASILDPVSCSFHLTPEEEGVVQHLAFNCLCC